MISLDWKERLIKDVDDFYSRKLPEKDYDFSIIYNAYPERVENKIPREIVVYVAKHLAAKLAKKAENFIPFFDYLWYKKGDDGKVAFVHIFAKITEKKPEIFFEYLKNILIKTSEELYMNNILDKSIFPVIRKHPDQYLDKICNWLKLDNEVLINGVIKILIKLIKNDPELLPIIFRKIENAWLHANPLFIKTSVKFLKAVGEIDQNFYITIYERYRISREPIFSEILSGAICLYHPTIDEMVENWAKSGNVKLKKNGLFGKKLIAKYKK